MKHITAQFLNKFKIPAITVYEGVNEQMYRLDVGQMLEDYVAHIQQAAIDAEVEQMAKELNQSQQIAEDVVEKHVGPLKALFQMFIDMNAPRKECEEDTVRVTGPAEEVSVQSFNTLQKIVQQLQACQYECIGGPLQNNTAFISLKRMAYGEAMRFYKR
jgi:hypothetical protein